MNPSTDKNKPSTMDNTAPMPTTFYNPNVPDTERLHETTIHWGRSYGWRAGTRYIDSGASAVAVIRYEQEELDNALDVPDFLLEELARKQVKAREIVWVCQTREHARRYSGPGIRQPYKEEFGPHALIVATDNEPETGYLVLFDASRLDPAILARYAQYRQSQNTCRPHR